MHAWSVCPMCAFVDVRSDTPALLYLSCCCVCAWLVSQGANVYDIIKRPSLVLTEDAVAHLENFLKAK